MVIGAEEYKKQRLNIMYWCVMLFQDIVNFYGRDWYCFFLASGCKSKKNVRLLKKKIYNQEKWISFH